MLRLATLLLASVAASCSDADDSKRPQSDPCAGRSAADAKSWQGGIGAIFEDQCGSCHPGTQPTDYKSYSGVKGGIDDVLARIDDGSMPPGGLPTAETKAIHAWAEADLPQTSPDDPVCP